jgi:hypothetical protein
MNQQQRAVVQQLMDAARVAGITVQCAVVQQQVSTALAAGKALLEQPEPVQEPLGYWNAVQGWVELPEDAHKPIAWVYPEAIQAFLQGKPWTAYGADSSGANTDGVDRIPLYTTPPAQPAVPLTDEQANLLINGRGDEDDDDYVEPTGDGFGLTDEDLVKLIRRVEAHHGIGVKL